MHTLSHAPRSSSQHNIMASPTVDISRLSTSQRLSLLEALWRQQRVSAFFGYSGIIPPRFNARAAEKKINGYIDYFCGRAINMDLSKDTIDARLYLRDLPPDAKSVEELVADLH